MKCPICRKKVAIGDPFIPFCSERCKVLDLGNWASEKYVISTPAEPGWDQDSDEPSSEGS